MNGYSPRKENHKQEIKCGKIIIDMRMMAVISTYVCEQLIENP